MSGGEAEIIKILQQGHSQILPPGSLGIGDDCARVPLSGASFLTSTDMLLEGEDFSLSWATPEDIGHKSLAVNISDLAAMGCRPLGYLLSLALPDKEPTDFVRRFTAGISRVSRQYRCPLFGGDLSATKGPITINIVVFGEMTAAPLCRRRAAAGEDIYVAGRLGGAAAGLHLLQHHPELLHNYAELCACQLRPTPLVEMGQKLAQSGLVTSAMDISDGIASDLPRLLPAGCGALIVAEKLPLVAGVAEYAQKYALNIDDLTVRGGEDYGLLFTAPLDAAPVISSLADKNCPISKIGSVTTSSGCYLIHGLHKELLAKGFDHFS